jgi:hypothetical protein
LFFEIDDNRANLNLEDILKTNDGLTQEMKKIIDEDTKLRRDNAQLKNKLAEQSKALSDLSRQKDLDDMAISGFKSLKLEATNEIVKLKETVESLKLDLLAEKQLRRIHQQTLHSLDPENENYNIDTITERVGTSSSESCGVARLVNFEVPFWKLSCEAKPVPEPSKSNWTPHVIPKKMMKTSVVEEPRLNKKTSRRGAYFLRPQRQSPVTIQGSEKPDGFQFVRESGDTGPSTSSSSQNNKVCKKTVNQPIAGPSSAVFKFSSSTPKSSAATSSLPPSTTSRFTWNSPLFGAREPLNEAGPKSSDR